MPALLHTSTATTIAAHIAQIRDEVLARWRDEVRRNSEQAAVIHKLTEEELQDHLPALIEEIIRFLRGEPTLSLDEDAAQHGRQRRALGYSVVPLLRELQIFRRVLTGMVHQIIGKHIGADEFERQCELIIDVIDRSTNISVMQYTLAAESERNCAQGEARELHEQRDRFLATLSHELRNQVSPILLGTRLLKDLKPTDPRIARVVERIERQARHQAILIDDLLDISRFRYGKLQLNRKDVDLRAPIRHALETLRKDFETKRLQFEVELPATPLHVMADETRIAQVVINLLSNALKFTSPGGTVAVKCMAQGMSAVLTVRDNGIGINSDVLPHIFTMFFQTDESSKMLSTGLGIGLALAKVLVGMHGGTIEARSDGENKGAEFTITLPLVAAVPENSQGLVRTVLVVDDNPDQLELLADLLEVGGYRVIRAHGALEALRLVSEEAPDACIIDIGLPDIDGYGLARELRTKPQTREARLIAVTGYITKADEQNFERAGFDYYFSKPPNFEDLNRALG